MIRFGLENLRFRRISFFLYAIASIFSVPSRLLRQDSTPSSLALFLFLGAIVTIFIIPFLWMVSEICHKMQLGSRSIYIPLGLVALIGAIRGVVVQSTIRLFGLEDNLNLFGAVVSSTIFTLIYFVGISSFMEVVLQKKERFAEIFEQAKALLIRPEEGLHGKVPKETYGNAMGKLKTSLQAHLGSDGKDTAIDPKSASLEIQKQINEVLRPLSHRLWITSMGQIRHKNVGKIVRDSIENLEFNITYFLAYQFFIGGYGISLVLGIKSAFYISSLAIATSLILIMLRSWLKSRMRRHSIWLNSIFLFCVGLLPVLVPIAVRNPLNESASLLAGLVISPTLPGLLVLASTYKLVTSDREFAISAASTVGWRVSAEGRGALNAGQDIELAEYFHNSLQSELFGIAKKLETISQDGDRVVVGELIGSLDAALNREYEEIHVKEIDGIERILNLIDSWQGIASITISGVDHLGPDSEIAFRVSQILEEMVTNSIRYGESDAISIEISSSGENLTILLKHNGKGEIAGKAGMGTILLSKYSKDGVLVESKDGQTQYKINLIVDRNTSQ